MRFRRPPPKPLLYAVIAAAAFGIGAGVGLSRAFESGHSRGVPSNTSAAPLQAPAQPVPAGQPQFQRRGICRKSDNYAQCHPTAGTFRPDPTRLADCGSTSACYEQAFGNLAYYRGPRAALRIFDRMRATNSVVAADCHRTVHVIGAGALARFHGNVGKAFSLGSASCWSGYYHGILERAFTNVGTTKGLGKVARRLCASVKRRSTVWIAYQCVHGLGHGLMIFSGYNLPFALSICDQLATSWDQTSCSGGVFMENIVSSYGTPSPWLRKNDPVFPCGIVKEKFKYFCYAMVTSRINELDHYDWRKTAATCRTVERNWVATCFQSMGRDASGSTTQNPRKALSICSVDRRWWLECVNGAVRDMTATYANGERASQLCGLLQTSLQPNCFWQIGTMLGTMSRTDAGRRALCEAASKKYVRNCMQGADAASSRS